MAITEINAKSILRKHKKIDSWFVSHYGMNLYRGCSHNCVYCDGRAEGYYVDGEFGRDVEVKVNALEVLTRELDPKRKRVPLQQSYMVLGGGVGDSYQPLEKKYQLSRKVLELFLQYDFPVHVLTKSILVSRDIDILKLINQKTRAVVSFSFSSLDGKISALVEPGVPPPMERLKAISFFKKEGLACGMFLMPVVPFITDMESVMEETVVAAAKAGVDFIIFGGMTLKDGRQKEYFFKSVEMEFPLLRQEYSRIYRGSQWGAAVPEYYTRINRLFAKITEKYKIPVRMPPFLYRDVLSQEDRIIVILEHLDYLLRLKGRSSPYGYAAYCISRLKQPLPLFKDELLKLEGIRPAAADIIKEIADTGTCTLYESLLYS
ncbi:MAG: radical SAM protein [Spirochaetota bacterium]